MKFFLIASAALITLAGTSTAMAEPAKTRTQVKAELAQAVQAGDILASDDTTQTLNQLYPQRYPAVVAAAGKTRSDVLAELDDATRTGDLIAGEDLQKQNERRPDLYPAISPAPVKARAQARTEAADAWRTGLALAHDSR